MDFEFISSFSPIKLSRERALSYNSSQCVRVRRFNKSLDRFLYTDKFLKEIQKNDHEQSSIASDFPSFHGVAPNNVSQHSLNVETRNGITKIFDILNDPGVEKINKSEKMSVSSTYSFGEPNTKSKQIFQIPSEPFRILDTPGIQDNYYSNVLAWSSLNFISICLSNVIYLFNYETSEFDQLYEADDDENITSLTYSLDGTTLGIGNDQGILRVLDIASTKMIVSKRIHNDRITCMDWGRHGLLTGSKDKKILNNDVRTSQLSGSKFEAHSQEIVGLKWSPSDSVFASGSNDNNAFVWTLGEESPQMKIKHRAGIRALGWSDKTHGLLATGGGISDKTIRTYNTSQSCLLDERATEGQVCSLVFSKLTNDLISSHGSPTNDISVWRLNGLKRVIQLSGHDIRPLHICLSPDGSILASASADETLRFWKLYNSDVQNAKQESCQILNLKSSSRDNVEVEDDLENNYEANEYPDSLDDYERDLPNDYGSEMSEGCLSMENDQNNVDCTNS